MAQYKLYNSKEFAKEAGISIHMLKELKRRYFFSETIRYTVGIVPGKKRGRKEICYYTEDDLKLVKRWKKWTLLKAKITNSINESLRK